ncbi:hypothetical protein [Pseudomonas mohnii]
MTDFMYRFRPVKRLLGENGAPGELDNQHIFFASPEQLNDPLEGYKDIYFQGDKIVWKNLIKHYLRCLIESSLDYVCAEKGEIPIKKAGVFATAVSATEQMNKLNHDIFEKLISEPIINEFISTISLNRKVRRWELLAYIQTLHFYFLDTVLESFHEVGILTEPLNYFPAKRNELLGHIKNSASVITTGSQLTEEQESEFLKTYQNNSERQLLTRLRTEGKGREYWFFLLFEYPETFCRDIEKLMYPSWYTACFMSSCSDSSIWGTYGGNHKDVCLKFRTKTDNNRMSMDLTAPNGQDLNGITWGTVSFSFHEVSYEKSFVDLDFFRSLGHLPMPVLSKTWFMGDNNEHSSCCEGMYNDQENWRKDYWKNFYHSATVKLRAWDREKESRLILSSSINNLEDDKNRKLRYKFDSLEGIIFGINTPTESKLSIIKTIERQCMLFQRPDFSFYQARYDERSREIIYDKLESIKVGYTYPTSG